MRNVSWAAALSCGVTLAACGGSAGTTGTTGGAATGTTATTGTTGTGATGTTGTGATGTTGSGGGTTGTTTSTGTAGTGGSEAGCQPILSQTGDDTGFDTCAGGTIERRADLVCPTAASSTTDSCAMQHGATCHSDADCTAQPLGYCADSRNLVGYCGCFYGCVKDADCGAGFVCECESVVGTCVPSTCTTNASCGAGSACLLTGSINASGGCGGNVFTCKSPKDQCEADMDCQANGGACLLQGDHRVCSGACQMHP